jgi:hypothetical protein|tara:strand:- start:963 stop:1121 length:159 start_codon:yes stop_codon:yes gene_type:complete
MEWVAENWEYILIGFYSLEKVVKLSPSKKDDILFDIVFDGLKKLMQSMVGKK